MIPRRPDWQARLGAYLAEVRQRPFSDAWHCALFAAGAVEAQTGVDLAAPYRGRWTSVRGGLRVLRRDGYRDHLALVAAHLEEVAPDLARPGDVVALEGDALGIAEREVAFVLAPAGLALVERARAARAFRVGA